MADPRVSGYVDDFDRANEDPLSQGGNWDSIASDVLDMQLLSNRAGRHDNTNDAFSYHIPSGPTDGDIEVWGERHEVGYQIGQNERLGLWQNPNSSLPFSSVGNGYELISNQSPGSQDLYLRRYTGGSFVNLVVVEVDKNWQLLRRNGNFVEIWSAITGIDDWVMHIQVTDTTWMTNLYIACGEQSQFDVNDPSGWNGIGGGVAIDFVPQIYRRPNE